MSIGEKHSVRQRFPAAFYDSVSSLNREKRTRTMTQLTLELSQLEVEPIEALEMGADLLQSRTEAWRP
jgi:hypothetical protein